MMQVTYVLLGLLGLNLLTACTDSKSSDSAATVSMNLTPIARIAALYGNKSLGSAVAASIDGRVVAIGAKASTFSCEESDAPKMVTVGGSCNETANVIGGVHVYHVDGDDTTGFVIKPFKQDASFEFGADVSVSDDGQWLAIGSPQDSMRHASDATKCAGSMTATVATADCTSTVTTTTAMGYQAGAVYIFKYSDDDKTWELKHYVKPLHAHTTPFINYQFGRTVALTSDASGVIVGVPTDKSSEVTNLQVEPTLSSLQSLERGSTFHYSLSDAELKFYFYHQSSVMNSEHSGKILHTVNNADLVAVAGDSRWFLAKHNSKNSELDLSSLSLPAEAVVSDMAQSSDILVLGLDKMKSDCNGIKSGDEVANCYNANGAVSEAGAVLIYTLPISSDGPMSFMTLEQPIPNAHFGRSVMVSQDSQFIWVGANDNHGCIGTFDTIDACKAEGATDLMASGAVYQYKKSGDTWVLDKFMKAAKVEANGNFGGSNQLLQRGNLFYFGYDRSDLCTAYTANIEDVCITITNLPPFHYEVRSN
jgi:hypothetical protein